MSMLPAALLLLHPAVAQANPPAAIDNAYVRVMETGDFCRSAASRPGQVNHVVVYLSACELRAPAAGGQPITRHWNHGDVEWIPAGTAKTCESPAGKPCRVVVVEIKAGAGRTPVEAGPQDPIAVDPAHYRPLVDNPQVRVLRARFGPHETSAMHQHARDRLTLLLTDADLRPTTSEGEKRVLRGKAGDLSWVSGGPTLHTEYNASTQPFEVIAIEIKRR